MTRICNKCGEYEHDCFCQQPMTLLERLKNYIGIMSTHQRERMGGELLIEATSELEALQKERDALKVEYESRAIWIANMLKALDCENKDGFHCVDAHFVAKTLRAQNREMREALNVAINTVECDSVGKDGNELPWYRMAKLALSQPEAGKV